MRIIWIPLSLVLASGCRQESPQLRVAPEQRAVSVTAREGEIQAGGSLPEVVVKNPYEGNAHAIAEGERLFLGYKALFCLTEERCRRVIDALGGGDGFWIE